MSRGPAPKHPAEQVRRDPLDSWIRAPGRGPMGRRRHVPRGRAQTVGPPDRREKKQTV